MVIGEPAKQGTKNNGRGYCVKLKRSIIRSIIKIYLFSGITVTKKKCDDDDDCITLD